MSARPWIAFVLLVNYLLVVGIGCVSRPEEQREMVLVQTSEVGHPYQQCRYLRMDGLESFLEEALASHYQNAPQTSKHHLISVISGVDAHCLTDLVWPLTAPVCRVVSTPLGSYQSTSSFGINRAIYPPPRVG